MQKPSFRRILIVNRGEIAARIARTAVKMGLEPILVYSDADSETLAVKEAKEAYRLGPARAADSYLNSEKIFELAKATGAEAIHPGYGFLSENSAFAREVVKRGMVWIGPTADSMDMVSSKSKAKDLAEKAQVPTVPGFRGEQKLDRFVVEAAKIGYPVLLKATAGGGGRGIRHVKSETELKAQFDQAKTEAKAGFGDDELLLEKYIEQSRHIEVQIFGDTHGGAIHLGERDCSVQRRHQKLIEESPSPAIDAQLRNEITSAAVRLAKACGYINAGTAEFLVTPKGQFYFLEVNARLQVEHTVTEMVTGLDLVEWQFRVAQGEPLPLKQEQVRFQGHAIQTRLYAEDPYEGYRPQTGPVTAFTFPEGIRVDHFLTKRTEISPYYDSMLAKIIVHAPTRELARKQAIAALDWTLISGIKTNRDFLKQLLQQDFFTAGQAFTQTLDRSVFAAIDRTENMKALQMASLAAYMNASRSLRFRARTNSGNHHARLAWRDGKQLITVPLSEDAGKIKIGETIASNVEWRTPFLKAKIHDREVSAVVHLMERSTDVLIEGEAHTFTNALNQLSGTGADADPNAVTAPMAGTVTKVLTEAKRQVKTGDVLAIIEAMKMQLELRAPRDGIVDQVQVIAGAQVKTRQVLMRLEAKE